MMRNVRTAAFAGVLALAGLAATADRADAQVYYSYYPGTTYYYNTTPYGGYQTYTNPGTTYSYATPYNYGTWTTPGYTYNSYYTTPYAGYNQPFTGYTQPYNMGYNQMPYSTWNGNMGSYPYSTYNQGYVGQINDAVNTYRAVRGIFRR